jgi:hypothetical protein
VRKLHPPARSTGGSFSLSGIEAASLTGGAGNNSLNAGGFTAGSVTLDGGDRFRADVSR